MDQNLLQFLMKQTKKLLYRLLGNMESSKRHSNGEHAARSVDDVRIHVDL